MCSYVQRESVSMSLSSIDEDKVEGSRICANFVRKFNDRPDKASTKVSADTKVKHDQHSDRAYHVYHY